jgi:hypothetical protein
VWPAAAPQVRRLLGPAVGAEPGGIGSVLEGAAASMDAEMLALGMPGGYDSLVSEPGGAYDLVSGGDASLF